MRIPRSAQPTPCGANKLQWNPPEEGSLPILVQDLGLLPAPEPFGTWIKPAGLASPLVARAKISAVVHVRLPASGTRIPPGARPEMQFGLFGQPCGAVAHAR
uniref:DHA14-like major facilitator n=1 Tax=Ganoderma boninense TaxID=34458 RepID=A0A5K1JVA3_9APHY|nr:DHA14-like major facilitator [Ganoderma boninense]